MKILLVEDILFLQVEVLCCLLTCDGFGDRLSLVSNSLNVCHQTYSARAREVICLFPLTLGALEGLAPVVLRKPKVEPRDSADIPVSNPNDPIDLESSPEPLLRTKAVKRKQAEVEAMTQPTKKVLRRKIGKKGNLDAFVTKLSPEKPIPSAHMESFSIFNDDLLPPSPRPSIRKQLEGTKAVETEAENVVEVEKPEVEVEKPIEVELEAEKIVEMEAVDVGVTHPKSPEVVAHEPEKGKSIQEDPPS
ncbi:hypothetical protein Hanom_Chr13g01203781 [Helianthus anomalus]